MCSGVQRIIMTFPHIRSLCLSHIRPGPRSLDLVLDVYSHFKNQIQELTILFCNSIPTLLALLQAIAGSAPQLHPCPAFIFLFKERREELDCWLTAIRMCIRLQKPSGFVYHSTP